LSEPDTVLLHQYLIEAADRFAGAAAVAEAGAIVTFRELLERASAVAAALRDRGLVKGDRVALVMAKTTDAITAVFATLLAGGVYVPVQPRWPPERIASTLEDCGARFVFAEPGLHLPISTLDLQALSRGSGRFWDPGVAPEDPAFILFTSGSTGRPKGVTLSHRAVAAFVNWSGREFQVGPDDRIACPSPLSFDLSTFDIFNMARSGATCVLVPEQNAWFPRFVTQFLEDECITVWYSVPSMLAGMLNDGGLARRSYPRLRTILFAGEVFPAAQVARLQAALPGVGLYNLYGPTETNVTTWHAVPAGFDGGRPVPIGRPCPYARVALQDDELPPAGESLMTGYWNRPAETARAFVEIEGVRYYRSGDRVTMDAQGDLVFLGRMDRQVKRRGFRIELGEIEEALSRHEAVLEAAVVSTSDEDSGTTITAFVRLAPGGPVSQADLRAHCARVTPGYMLPDRIVPLPSLPKGSRGKIDYLALSELIPRK